MPIWGYFYCGLFLFSCCFSIFDKDRLKTSYQPAGEILDCLCATVIFLIGFSVVQFQFNVLISSLCFVYTFAWSYHAHRHYLTEQTEQRQPSLELWPSLATEQRQPSLELWPSLELCK